MESNSQPSTEVKTTPSQYQNSLHDDDLVDMNEIIQCNLDEWNLGANEPAHDIKLEPYNFLGKTIDYEDDKFEFDSLNLQQNYFETEVGQHFESDEDNDRQMNGLRTNVADCNNDVIDIADDSSDDDDVVDLLNSSSESTNMVNVSICPNLDSIRSDHNYSSQEVQVGTYDEANEPVELVPNLDASEAVPDVETPQSIVPITEHTNEPVDYVNEMQGLIATWINNADREKRTTILTDLESEIKRIKSTVMDGLLSQNITGASVDTSQIESNATNVTDDNENDSNYIMSEEHSEPLEYQNGQVVLLDDKSVCEKFGGEVLKSFKEIQSVLEKLSTKTANFSKLLGSDPFPCEIAKTELMNLSNSGQELVKSIQMMAASLKFTIDAADINENTSDVVPNTNETASGNGETVDEIVSNDCGEVTNEIGEVMPNEINGNHEAEIDEKTVSQDNGEVDDITDGEIIRKDEDQVVSNDSEIMDGKDDDKINEGIDDNVVDKVDEQIDDKVDDTVVECKDKVNVVVDKQQLDLNSKKRWLASSTEEESGSDDSYTENVPVKRRKKRVRSASTSDDQSKKNLRTKNVLLDSSDDEQSIEGSTAPTDLNPVQSSEEAELTDLDMSKYFLPSDAPTNKSIESEPCDDNDDRNEQRVDSELEEFFGFDGPNCDGDEISSFHEEVVIDGSENTTDERHVVDEDSVTTGEPILNDPIVFETEESDNDPKLPYIESQQWELPESPIIDNKNNEILEDNNVPQKVNNENGGEHEVDNVVENCDENNIQEVVCKTEVEDEEENNLENNHNDEEGSEYDTDEEIDRLVDLSNIPTRTRPIVNYVPVFKKRSISKPKPKENILDLLKDSGNQDVESESSSEEDIVSEEQYVLQLAKQQCLKDSSDSDGADSVSTDVDDNESSVDDVSDESNDSTKLNRFLKKRLVNEIEDHLASEEKILETPPKDISIVEHKEDEGEDEDEDEQKAEEESELQSSGIFEPEIELHDGEKPPDSDIDDDDDETTEQQKDQQQPKPPTDDKKKWKLDRIAFNKNLFDNLDDPSNEKTAKTTNSDNSDCEMLDISMFKTKKGEADLDKIIQNQKKRDVSKVSSKVAADECISLSSDSDLEIDKGTIDDDSEDDKPTKSRPMLRNDQLAGETKQAQKEETDRLKRLEKKNDRLTQIVESQTEKLSQSNDLSDVILDFDTKQNCAICVHPEIVKNLKEHQIAGVKFMYDCCYGSVDSIEKHNGSGCILAHCMGLGKTLQLIALLHTLIRYPQLKTKKILVICPKSTIMNWADEIQTWLRSVKVKLKVLHFPDPSDLNKKLQILREWHSFKADPEGRAGCMLIGYEAFRSLVFYAEKPKQEMSQVELDRIKKLVDEYLLKPGADLVVCDEGHVIKNRKSTTSRAVNRISSRRRIILTGTPIQNNLKEYYSMVNFIKPSFLGTEKEFANLYENPIKEGQHKDSNNAQIRIMKQRSYVLHKKLSKFVQRREAALLKTFLPEKYEYVLFIPMTELQNRLYQYFLDNNPLKEKFGGKSLIPDYTFLRKIWTHPKVLENAWKNAIALRDKKAAIRKRNMDSDEEPDDVLDNQVGKMSVENDWWRQFIEPQDLRSLLPSNKLRILFEILKLCEQNGEKCLIFSAFVAVLDVVEFFMEQIHNKVSYSDGNDLGLDNFHGPWRKNCDYFRLDGKTSKALRHAMIQSFNDPNNTQVKCFLISAKAGGQGINLVGANRVILLDTSWNPSNDQQNIFRVFRLGQQKKCYIYRLLAMGTMEEKVYSRSVTKQAMSFRVVDEQQIDRHYSLAELAELYTLTKPDPAAQPTPVRPVDYILASLLRNFKSLVYKYHEHDSLLENNSAEDLNEQEKADAWEAYEKDVSMKNQFGNMNITADGMYSSSYGSFGMNFNMMNPYSYVPPNLPASMVSSYLQRMGYTSSVGPEQELMLLSQMYSQYNQSGGSSAYGPLNAMFNTPSSATTNPLYGSTSASSNYYKTANTSSTTTSPSSYSNLASNVFSGISSLTSSSSSAAYNLSRYMPPYSSSSSVLGSSFPFNLYPTSSSAGTTNNAANQPGPNAIKNPLLSNLLPPSTSNTKDSFSIPTSVITKASKDMQRSATSTSVGPVSLSSTSMSSNVMSNFNQSHQKTATHSNLSGSLNASKGSPLMVARASPLPNARASPLSNARASPLSSARGSPSIAARSSPSVKINTPSSTRNSPPESRTNASVSRTDALNSLSITRNSTTLHKTNPMQPPTPQLPLSITLTGTRTSPEPNIIVKDVSAINRTVDRKSATTTTSSKPPTTQPIKNFNMGIVYPKPQEKGFDLSQNDGLLKAAGKQMQLLHSNTTTKVTPNQQPKNRISLAQPPNRTAADRPVNRINNVKSATRTVDTNVTSSSATSSAKNHISPNLPTNEVTITPTKRLHKVAMSMAPTNTHKLAPSTTISPSTSNKPQPIGMNKLSGNSLSINRLPPSTSITRQISTSTANTSIARQVPTSSINANKIVGRTSNPPQKQNLQQSTLPSLKLISQPSSNNIKAGGITSRAQTTAMNRSQITRVVTTNNGPSKLTVPRQQPSNAAVKVLPSSLNKLANFAISSSESRKRKLEELIPKNTGVTLIKKSKVNLPDNTFVQSKRVPPQRAREPTSSSTVEIVELE